MSATERLHELKTWPEHFDAILDGSKPYEVRLDDRDFAVGDLVRLAQYQPPLTGDLGYYTGRETTRRVTHVLERGTFGLRPYYVVLGLAPVDDDGGHDDVAVDRTALRLLLERVGVNPASPGPGLRAQLREAVARP